MKVTPLDLRQSQFATSLRGYDKNEVRALLADGADEFENALREVDRLRQELQRAESALTEHRDREVNLRNTLLTAQRLADQIKDAAEQEARMIVREAEGRSDLLLQKTQARLSEIEREITELKLRRRDVEASLEASISALHNALDFIRAKDQGDRDEKLLLHRPRPAAEAVRAAVLDDDLDDDEADEDEKPSRGAL
ncbi:MAG: DivIVA domain-containing protein [Acidobacteria bacterium]|jgi:cell division initiation protein|nr:DivIVA domain-containing protein [Acidobacteriota bacterium]